MEPRRITPEQVKRHVDAGERVTFLDARADDAWRSSDRQITGSIRVPPNDTSAHLDEIPRAGLIVPYCT